MITEEKDYYSHGQIRRHCFYKDGKLHGEYKRWRSNGQLRGHYFHKDGEDITDEVKGLVTDIKNITAEEHMIIKLHHGVNCI